MGNNAKTPDGVNSTKENFYSRRTKKITGQANKAGSKDVGETWKSATKTVDGN